MFQSQDRLFIYIFSTCPFYFFGKKKKKKKYGKNRKILWYVNHVMRYALTVTYRQALGFRLQASEASASKISASESVRGLSINIYSWGVEVREVTVFLNI